MSSLAVELVNAAARSLLVAAAVAAAMALLRVRGGAPRLRIWRWILYAALAMPLLLALEPRWQMPLPLLPPSSAPVTSANTIGLASISPSLPASRGSAPVKVAAAPSATTLPAQPPRRALSLSLAEVIYLLIAGAFLLRLAFGWSGARRVLRQAVPVGDAALLRDAASAAVELGINHLPRMLESSALVVPATLSVWRPAVVLPSAWPEWLAEKRQAVLLHELAHVARRDALIQRLSLLHRALFWFSPLGWWLHRALQDLAEQASDEAVLRAGAGREGYAEVLLDFLRELRAAHRPAAWEGVAMARGARAERRIDRILSWQGGVSMKNSSARNLGLVLAVASLALMAAAARPVIVTRQQAASPAAIPSLPAPPAPSPLPVPRVAVPPSAPQAPAPVAAPVAVPALPAAPVAVPALAEPAPKAATPPAAPLAPAPQTDGSALLSQDITVVVGSAAAHWSGSGCEQSTYSSDDQTLIAIGDCAPSSLTSAGVTWAARITPSSVFFEEGGKSSRISDPAIVQKARQLFMPMLRLEAQQATMSQQQADLGRRQEDLGSQQSKLASSQVQSEVKVETAQLLASLEALHAEIEQLHDSASQAALANLQSQLGSMQARIRQMQVDAIQSQIVLARQQEEAANRQAQLSAMQADFAAQQSALSDRARIEAHAVVADLHTLLSRNAR